MMAISSGRKALQTQSSIFILGAIICGGINTLLREQAGAGAPFGGLNYLLTLLAWASWGVGCVRYAQSKAYPWAMGLIGLVPCLGIIILVVMPNKWQDETTPPPSATNYPRPPSVS